MRSILITGTSSGFGRLTAETLVARGHTVFASMRDPTGRNADAAAALEDAGARADGTLHVLELDVTDDASVTRAVERARGLSDHLDVVINNAGVGATGYLELYTPEQLRELYEVNVFGVHRVNRAVIPGMRARGEGLLVMMSSVLGRVVMPFMGPYPSSKFALEGYSDALSVELKPLGIDVAIVEPGAFGTHLFDNMRQPEDDARAAQYGELIARPDKMWAPFIARMSNKAGPPLSVVVDAIVTLIDTPTGARPLRTVVDATVGASVETINDAQARLQERLHAKIK